MLLSSHKSFPFHIKLLNVVDKKSSKILSKKENENLTIPVSEIFFNHESEIPLNDSHIISYELSSVPDLKIIHRICTKLNVVLKSFFERRNFTLAEHKCYFGKYNDKVFVTGDFSPTNFKIFSTDGNANYLNKFNTPFELKKYTETFLELIKS